MIIAERSVGIYDSIYYKWVYIDLTGIKISYFQRTYQLEPEKAFEEEEEQERKALLLKEGKKGGSVKKGKEATLGGKPALKWK